MTYRDQERARAKKEAENELLNKNGMHRDQSPASTRSVAEAKQTVAQPDPEPAPRDHSTVAGTTAVQYGGSVRDRLERTIATKRDEKPTRAVAQDADAQAWLKYNEEYRAKHGCYPPN
jgi:hypothetical protein